jgi:hypothetical protein
VLSFLYYDKILDKNNFKGGKIYFTNGFRDLNPWSFYFITHHLAYSEAEHHNRGKGVRANLLTSWWPGSR